LEIEEILKDLERSDMVFPREALEQAIAHREQIIPELLKMVERANQDMQRLADDPNCLGPFYAMFLLAQFRETRSYPLIVDFFLTAKKRSEDIAGDIDTQYFGRLLASVCGGDLHLVKQVIENPDVDEYLRSSALEAPVTLVGRGEKPREEIIAYFQELFRGKLERRHSFVWDALVNCALDLWPEELLKDIEWAYEQKLVWPGTVSREDVKGTLAEGRGRTLAHLRTNPQYQLINDTIREFEWWDCFGNGNPNALEKDADRDLPDDEEEEDAPLREEEAALLEEAERNAFYPGPQTVMNESPKIGRNDPCPCGSGKKYKKCCGAG